MNIRQKLLSGFLLVALPGVIVGLVGVNVSRNTHTSFENIARETIPLIEALDDLKMAGLRIVASTSEYVFIRAEQEAAARNNPAEKPSTGAAEAAAEEKELIDSGIVLFDNAMKCCRQLISRYMPAHAEHIIPVVNAGQELQRISAEIITLKKQGVSGREILAKREDFAEAERRFLHAVNIPLKHENSLFAQKKVQTFNLIDTAINRITWISILTFVLALVIGLCISHAIAKPIGKLKEMAAEVGKGNLDVRIEVKSKDEIGRLGNSFNIMAEQLEKANLETQRAIKAAEEASRAKSEFLANMSHEIRTPMNSIFGMSNLALNMESTPKLQEYLKIIDSSAHSLLRIIDDILDFSKIEAGKLEMETIPFQLSYAFDRVIDLFGERLAEKGIDLLTEIGPDLPNDLIGDPLRLDQIINNLIGNALKFTEHGEIILRVKCVSVANDKVKLAFSVQDSGVGIQPEHLQQIFNPFEQADGSTTRKFGGTGLGLPISKRLVTMMGGEIWAESKGGEGSIFHFTAEFELQHAKSARDLLTPGDLRGLKILLVDPNPLTQGIRTAKLAALTFEVAAIATAKEALEKLKGAMAAGVPFKLMIMDWQQGGEDIVVVWEELKRQLQPDGQLPGVIITSFRRKTDLERARASGIDAFLQKPFKDSALFNTIMRTFDKSYPDMLVRPTRISQISKEALRGCKVLLAEDNELNKRLAVELLQVVGIQDVHIVANGIEAIRAVHETPDFDVVLMDGQMPEMDGFEAARQIRRDERFKHLPIIAMTAHAMSGDRERCLAAGMDDYVSKPIDPHLLYATLTKWFTPKAVGKSSIEEESSNTGLSDNGLPASLPGIDLDVVVRRYGPDMTFYRNLLQDFAASYANAALEIRQRVENGELPESKFLVHSLKGVAGNMCFNELYDAVRELEEVLQKEDLQDIETLLNTVADMLNQVVASAQLIAGREKTDEIASAGIEEIDLSPEQAALLSEFAALLKRNDLEAESHLESLIQLPGLRTEAKMSELAERVNSYQYKEAQTILTDIMANKKITLI